MLAPAPDGFPSGGVACCRDGIDLGERRPVRQVGAVHSESSGILEVHAEHRGSARAGALSPLGFDRGGAGVARSWSVRAINHAL